VRDLHKNSKKDGNMQLAKIAALNSKITNAVCGANLKITQLSEQQSPTLTIKLSQ
jgi:hypothetical protein